MLLAACVWICAPVASAHAQIEFAPCGNTNNFACGHLTVPLDPTGAIPGTVTLAIRRHRAAVGEARTAIIALAGGPGSQRCRSPKLSPNCSARSPPRAT